ncbi:hypothetical protein HWV62_3224 [Athelia sp. TMB]|nr:hypothetical protein HWV62_3224 [Athelia sp. TMB]
MSSKTKSEAEWRTVLSPQQFKVLRQKGTEAPGTGEYDKFDKPGTYNCGGCGTPLYTSATKFNSGCGWPAFFDGAPPSPLFSICAHADCPPAIPGAINRHEDRSAFMTRTEITCAACGGHLGHVFKGEGFSTPTDERHCVNSISLKFDDKQ